MQHKRLVIVWLSTDRQAAIDMAMLYARDSLLNGWWKEVDFFLWGPTVDAAANSEPVQTEIELMQSVGVQVTACLACASRYHVVDQLEQAGIPCRGLGEQLTEDLAEGSPVIFI